MEQYLSEFEKEIAEKRDNVIKRFNLFLKSIYIVIFSFGSIFYEAYLIRYIWAHFLTNYFGQAPGVMIIILLTVVFSLFTGTSDSSIFNMVCAEKKFGVLETKELLFASICSKYIHITFWWIIAYFMS